MPSKKCEAENCNKWASFNHPGLKRPMFCRPHALPGMVNVVSRQRCNFQGCIKQANFNHPGESRGAYCKAHIEPGMVDVRHKHCVHPGCSKQATCNTPEQSQGTHCGQHKLEGMVNVVLKRCQQEGCTTFPSFGLPGQPGVQYCRVHKLPGMVRRTATAGGMAGRQQDVNSMEMDPTRCAHPGCGDCRPIYCYNHYQAHQHDPMGQQIDENQLHYLQQLQSQQEVHDEHLQAEGTPQHVMGHQIPLDPQHHLHAVIAEAGIQAGYPEYAAWQHQHQQALAAAQQHELSGEQHVQYDHRSSMENSHDSSAPKMESYYGSEADVSNLRARAEQNRQQDVYHHMPTHTEEIASQRGSQD